MTKITYHDEDGSAPRVTWGGVKFVDGVPVEVDDEALVQRARRNRFFEVDGEAGDAPAKRRGGWPAGKPRKPREEASPPAEEIEEGEGGDDE